MVVDCGIAPAHGGDPIFSGDELVGAVTSAAFGHRVQKNLAMSYLPGALAAPGTKLEIEILGTRYPAEVLDGPAYDPESRLPRQ
jgi:dimethylglycine dehydrogenase